jgi:hypothetical protein
MAHIPMDDVRQLYQENKEGTWSGLLSLLRQHKGKAEGIEDSIIDTLMIVTQRLAQAHEVYPHSPEQMQRVLENELSKATA